MPKIFAPESVTAHPQVTAPADSPLPEGRQWSRAKRWASPLAGAMITAAQRAVAEQSPAGFSWDPEHCALLVVHSFAATDNTHVEISRLLAEHAPATPSAATELLYDELADFTYLRGLPSLTGQHIARALGGASSSCAVTSGWDSAQHAAHRMIRLGEVQAVLVVGPDDSTPDFSESPKEHAARFSGAKAQLFTLSNSTANAHPRYDVAVAEDKSASVEPAEVELAGYGAITPLGATFSGSFSALCEGKVEISRAAWMEKLPVNPAVGAIDDETKRAVSKRWEEKTQQKISLSEALALNVAEEVLATSGGRGRLGVVTTTMWPGVGGSDAEEWINTWNKRSVFSGSAPGLQELHQEPELTRLGTLLTAHTGREILPLIVEATCAGGIRALIEATRMVAVGDVEEALVIAVVARNNPYVVSQFAQLTALSRYRGEPAEASRPFDTQRAGMVMGEMATAILVRAADDSTGIRIEGSGLALDSGHPTALATTPVVQAIQRSMRSLGQDRMSVINAHGTGTTLNDAVESEALAEVFGEPLRAIPVEAVKGATGHASAASSLFEVAVLAESLRREMVPGVPTCSTPDVECGLNLSTETRGLPQRAGTEEEGVGLSLSFGFGGQYAAVTLRG